MSRFLILRFVHTSFKSQADVETRKKARIVLVLYPETTSFGQKLYDQHISLTVNLVQIVDRPNPWIGVHNNA